MSRRAALTELPIRHRRVILLCTAALAGAALLALRQTRFEDRLDIWFVQDDPELAAYRELKERFVSDEVILVALTGDELFTPAGLAALDRVTRGAAAAPHVQRALSLTTLALPRRGDDGLTFAPLADPPPTTDAAAAALRAQALSQPLLAGNLVAEDGRAAAVLVELDRTGVTIEAKRELVAELGRLIAGAAPLDGMLTGLPVLNVAFHQYSRRDLLLLAPLSFLAVGLAVFLMLRRLWAVAGALAVVLLAILLVFALAAAAGVKINILLVTLPTFLLVACVGALTHLLHAYLDDRRAGAGHHDAVRGALARVARPCVIAAGTTAAGALSLVASDLGPLGEFAWLAATGVLVALAATLLVLPALLASLPAPSLPPVRTPGRTLVRALAWLGRPSRTRAVATLGAALVGFGLLGLGIGRLQVGTNSLTYFRPDDPVRAATAFVDERLGGAGRVELLASAPAGGLKRPRVLARLEALQQWLTAHPAVVGSFSIVDLVKLAESAAQAAPDGTPGPQVLPTGRADLLLTYALLSETELFAQLVRDELSLARVQARVKLMQSEALAREVPALEEKLAREYADAELSVRVTGIVKLMHTMEQAILTSQVNGFSLAFVTIALLLLVLLRSVKNTLLVMIPNLLPAVMALGFMGWVGIRLTPGTVMIASLALGLVDDDTVHFAVRLKEKLAAPAPLAEALPATVVEVGRPLLGMSLTLALGFAVLLAGSFLPNVHFALVTLVVIALATVGNLVLLPALMTLTLRRR